MNFISISDSEYLDINELVDNTQIFKIGYVLEVSNSVSKLDSPFYRLLIRTVDGAVIPCMIFNIENFMSLGYTLNSLKGKYIKLNCRVRLHSGRMSLIFVNAEEVPVTPDLVLKFQKKIESLDAYASDLSQAFTALVGKEIPKYLQVVSFPQMYNGYSGGFVKFCWDVLMHTQATMSDNTMEEFPVVLYNTLIKYSNYLEILNKTNLISDSDRIELISSIPNNGYTDRLIRDTVSAVIGLGKPTHIISIIIYSTFEYVNATNNLKYNWSLVRPGGVVDCEGYDLIKY